LAVKFWCLNMAQVWEVVGGTGVGGILCREGKSIKSAECGERLSTGALVKQVAMEGDRLHFDRLTGSGQQTGWVSVKTKDKDLLVKSSKSVAEATGAAGGAAPAAASPAPAPAAASGGAKPAPASGTVPIALMFPGQGSQYVKMLAGVKDLPAVKAMLVDAKEILGYDMLDLCLKGPEEKLEETRYCQPAMFIAGMAGLEKLRAEKPDAATKCQMVAGLSLGEYTALCAAGVFTFEDALKLVKLRGECMQEAAEASKQAMLSVAGLDKPQLEKLCAEAAKKAGPKEICQVANCLFPKGFACAGTEKAVLLLKDAVEPIALQAKLLKTSGAFHTPLMQDAALKLGAALEELKPRMSTPRCTVYANATAQPLHPGTDPAVIVDLLQRQLTQPVLWEDCVRGMLSSGVKEYYEVGPMKQLKAMMKRIDMATWKTTYNVDV